jgi:Nif-specific regulatory protein
MVEEPVLILGETGTGKSLVARALHDASPRAKEPFQDWHVSAVPLDLLSRELFGAEAGAYTGAARRTDGAFHAANGGTLFLDEIGELTAEAQVVLLKAIEEKQIRRLGSTTAERVDVRIIAATNRPWEELRGRFREDFFYRITAFTIELPALRERPEDIALLARHLLQQHGCELVPAAEEVLLEYHWPGNVRELQHILKRVQVEATLEGTRTITSRLVRKVLQEHAQVPSSAVESLDDARLRTECQKIREALRKHGGNVTRAAKELGIRRETLSRRISGLKERCRELGYEIDPVLCKGENLGKSSTNGAQQ